jgi:hypothetical protein
MQAVLWFVFAVFFALGAQAQPSVAFFYGADAPRELALFDQVVVQPGHRHESGALAFMKERLFAYVSVGETDPDAEAYRGLPADWQLGKNAAWGGAVVDQSRPGWPAWFAENIVAPLWARGYRGFFLDTLDSYQLFATTAPARARQEAGLVATLRELRARFPGARLMLNRGFEILPQVHAEVTAVAVESLFQGWNNAKHAYVPVAEPDRRWLLDRIDEVSSRYRLPVVAIDYAAPEKRDEARAIAKKIRALGVTPWVANPELDVLGVGALEVRPRRVLLLYDGSEGQLIHTTVHRYLAMPLEHLGYVPQYLDVRGALPAHALAGTHAGIVSWLNRDDGTYAGALEQWLARQVRAGAPVAFVERFGFPLAGSFVEASGIHALALAEDAAPRLTRFEPARGLEWAPPESPREFTAVAGATHAAARLETRDGVVIEPVGYAAWGGYALAPFVLTELPGEQGVRWILDPFEFLARALRLGVQPAPDATTENGLRLAFAHVDGDGFPSRAEFPGSPYASRVMLDEVLARYRLPAAVSVIEGETGPTGLYPKASPELEDIARRIFALPHVEIASHSYSHPFFWRKLAAAGSGYNLAISGYVFDARREIEGSRDYIESRLAPPGKRCKLFLWTGDCNPDVEPLALAEAAGMLNMNGGETTIVRARPTLTEVAPLGIPRGERYQVYAPNQNENVYTNLWTGPFSGYEKVIETFELTDAPRRLKPVNIYYHTYAASKPAGLRALKKAYDWTVSRPHFPTFPSEYIARVHDFHRTVVAGGEGRWTLAGLGALRTVRLPKSAGFPDLDASRHVAGFADHNDARYFHLSAERAELVLTPEAPRAPYLVESNARLTAFRRTPTGLELGLAGHAPVALVLANAARCEPSPKPASARRTPSGELRLTYPGHAVASLRLSCT